jgi:hypothetical protein
LFAAFQQALQRLIRKRFSRTHYTNVAKNGLREL